MGSTSSPDPTMTPFESGMPRMVLRSAILSRGTLTRCRPLLTLPMGATLSLGPPTILLEHGMPILVLILACLSRGTPTRSSLLFILQMDGTSPLGLVTTLPVYGTNLHMLPSDLPLVTRPILNFLQSPTWMHGSCAQ